MNRVTDSFAEMVFSDQVMRERLPKAVYRAIVRTTRDGTPLDAQIADTVANAMRLLQLPQEVQWLIEQGNLSAGHGRAMLPLGDPDVEIDLAEEIMRKNLSVREVEERVRRMRSENEADGPARKASGKQERPQEIYYRDVERQLTQDLGRKVTITPGRKKGKLTLEYYDSEDLNALLSALTTIHIRGGEGTRS